MRRSLRITAAVLLAVGAAGLGFAGPGGSRLPAGGIVANASVTPPPSATATASVCPGGVCVGAGGGTSTPGSSGGGAAASTCTWSSGPVGQGFGVGGGLTGLAFYGLTAAEQAQVQVWLASNQPYLVGTFPYTTGDIVFCPDPTVSAVILVGTIGGTVPTASNVLGLWAESMIQFPAPSPGTSPPTTELIVQLPTYLYVDAAAWQTFTATTPPLPGGVSATATATPEYVVWQTGDQANDTQTCHGPGVAYSAGYGTSPPAEACSFTYTQTSSGQPNGQDTLTGTVWYHVTWTSTGVGGLGGDLGLVAGPAVSEQVTVDEIASVITAG